jgi:hypothetical protein
VRQSRQRKPIESLLHGIHANCEGHLQHSQLVKELYGCGGNDFAETRFDLPERTTTAGMEVDPTLADEEQLDEDSILEEARTAPDLEYL